MNLKIVVNIYKAVLIFYFSNCLCFKKFTSCCIYFIDKYVFCYKFKKIWENHLKNVFTYEVLTQPD